MAHAAPAWRAWFAFQRKIWQRAGGERAARPRKTPPTRRGCGSGRGWHRGPQATPGARAWFPVAPRPPPASRAAGPGACETPRFSGGDPGAALSPPPPPPEDGPCKGVEAGTPPNKLRVRSPGVSSQASPGPPEPSDQVARGRKRDQRGRGPAANARRRRAPAMHAGRGAACPPRPRCAQGHGHRVARRALGRGLPSVSP